MSKQTKAEKQDGHHKSVVLDFHLDGTCTVGYYLTDPATGKFGKRLSIVKFPTVPKRLQFFLEKGAESWEKATV